MINYFDSEFNEIAKSSIDSSLLFFSDDPFIGQYDDQIFSLIIVLMMKDKRHLI